MSVTPYPETIFPAHTHDHHVVIGVAVDLDALEAKAEIERAFLNRDILLPDGRRDAAQLAVQERESKKSKDHAARGKVLVAVRDNVHFAIDIGKIVVDCDGPDPVWTLDDKAPGVCRIFLDPDASARPGKVSVVADHKPQPAMFSQWFHDFCPALLSPILYRIFSDYN